MTSQLEQGVNRAEIQVVRDTKLSEWSSLHLRHPRGSRNVARGMRRVETTEYRLPPSGEEPTSPEANSQPTKPVLHGSLI